MLTRQARRNMQGTEDEQPAAAGMDFEYQHVATATDEDQQRHESAKASNKPTSKAKTKRATAEGSNSSRTKSNKTTKTSLVKRKNVRSSDEGRVPGQVMQDLSNALMVAQDGEIHKKLLGGIDRETARIPSTTNITEEEGHVPIAGLQYDEDNEARELIDYLFANDEQQIDINASVRTAGAGDMSNEGCVKGPGMPGSFIQLQQDTTTKRFGSEETLVPTEQKSEATEILKAVKSKGGADEYKRNASRTSVEYRSAANIQTAGNKEDLHGKTWEEDDDPRTTKASSKGVKLTTKTRKASRKGQLSLKNYLQSDAKENAQRHYESNDESYISISSDEVIEISPTGNVEETKYYECDQVTIEQVLFMVNQTNRLVTEGANIHRHSLVTTLDEAERVLNEMVVVNDTNKCLQAQIESALDQVASYERIVEQLQKKSSKAIDDANELQRMLQEQEKRNMQVQNELDAVRRSNVLLTPLKDNEISQTPSFMKCPDGEANGNLPRPQAPRKEGASSNDDAIVYAQMNHSHASENRDTDESVITDLQLYEGVACGGRTDEFKKEMEIIANNLKAFQQSSGASQKLVSSMQKPLKIDQLSKAITSVAHKAKEVVKLFGKRFTEEDIISALYKTFSAAETRRNVIAKAAANCQSIQDFLMEYDQIYSKAISAANEEGNSTAINEITESKAQDQLMIVEFVGALATLSKALECEINLDDMSNSRDFARIDPTVRGSAALVIAKKHLAKTSVLDFPVALAKLLELADVDRFQKQYKGCIYYAQLELGKSITKLVHTYGEINPTTIFQAIVVSLVMKSQSKIMGDFRKKLDLQSLFIQERKSWKLMKISFPKMLQMALDFEYENAPGIYSQTYLSNEAWVKKHASDDVIDLTIENVDKGKIGQKKKSVFLVEKTDMGKQMDEKTKKVLFAKKDNILDHKTPCSKCTGDQPCVHLDNAKRAADNIQTLSRVVKDLGANATRASKAAKDHNNQKLFERLSENAKDSKVILSRIKQALNPKPITFSESTKQRYFKKFPNANKEGRHKERKKPERTLAATANDESDDVTAKLFDSAGIGSMTFMNVVDPVRVWKTHNKVVTMPYTTRRSFDLEKRRAELRDEIAQNQRRSIAVNAKRTKAKENASRKKAAKYAWHQFQDEARKKRRMKEEARTTSADLIPRLIYKQNVDGKDLMAKENATRQRRRKKKAIPSETSGGAEDAQSKHAIVFSTRTTPFAARHELEGVWDAQEFVRMFEEEKKLERGRRKRSLSQVDKRSKSEPARPIRRIQEAWSRISSMMLHESDAHTMNRMKAIQEVRKAFGSKRCRPWDDNLLHQINHQVAKVGSTKMLSQIHAMISRRRMSSFDNTNHILQDVLFHEVRAVKRVEPKYTSSQISDFDVLETTAEKIDCLYMMIAKTMRLPQHLIEPLQALRKAAKDEGVHNFKAHQVEIIQDVLANLPRNDSFDEITEMKGFLSTIDRAIVLTARMNGGSIRVHPETARTSVKRKLRNLISHVHPQTTRSVRFEPQALLSLTTASRSGSYANFPLFELDKPLPPIPRKRKPEHDRGEHQRIGADRITKQLFHAAPHPTPVQWNSESEGSNSSNSPCYKCKKDTCRCIWKPSGFKPKEAKTEREGAYNLHQKKENVNSNNEYDHQSERSTMITTEGVHEALEKLFETNLIPIKAVRRYIEDHLKLPHLSMELDYAKEIVYEWIQRKRLQHRVPELAEKKSPRPTHSPTPTEKKPGNDSHRVLTQQEQSALKKLSDLLDWSNRIQNGKISNSTEDFWEGKTQSEEFNTVIHNLALQKEEENDQNTASALLNVLSQILRSLLTLNNSNSAYWTSVEMADGTTRYENDLDRCYKNRKRDAIAFNDHLCTCRNLVLNSKSRNVDSTSNLVFHGRDNQIEKGLVFLASMPKGTKCWMLDSGAQANMSNDPDHFTIAYHCKKQIDGVGSTTCSQLGPLAFSSLTSEKKFHLIALPKLYRNEKIPFPILSHPQLKAKGYRLIDDNKAPHLIHVDTGIIIPLVHDPLSGFTWLIEYNDAKPTIDARNALIRNIHANKEFAKDLVSLPKINSSMGTSALMDASHIDKFLENHAIASLNSGGEKAHTVLHMKSRQEKLWPAERIVSERTEGQQVMYKVRWKGFTQDHDSWVKKDDVSQDLIDAFAKRSDDQYAHDVRTEVKRAKKPLALRFPPIKLANVEENNSIRACRIRLHELYAHLGDKSIKKAVEMSGNAVLKAMAEAAKLDDTLFCDACAEGRAEMPPTPKGKTKRFQRPKDKVIQKMYVDPSGYISTDSIHHKYNYYLAATTDQGYSEVVGLKYKSQALLGLARIFAMMGIPKVVQFDNEGDLNTEVAHNYLAGLGVKVAVSEPYCHFRNGKIEARHKTWKSLARAMLNGSGLDVSYWYYAIRHAVLISNIALLGTNEKGDELNVTRWEAHYDNKPPLEMLLRAPFGTLCFLVLNEEQRRARGLSKHFATRAIAGLYLGVNIDGTSGTTSHLMTDGWSVFTSAAAIRHVPDVYPLGSKDRELSAIPRVEQPEDASQAAVFVQTWQRAIDSEQQAERDESDVEDEGSDEFVMVNRNKKAKEKSTNKKKDSTDRAKRIVSRCKHGGKDQKNVFDDASKDPNRHTCLEDPRTYVIDPLPNEFKFVDPYNDSRYKIAVPVDFSNSDHVPSATGHPHNRFVTRRIRKLFELGHDRRESFEGTVMKYSPDRALFAIDYDDGDKEELDFEELMDVLIMDTKYGDDKELQGYTRFEARERTKGMVFINEVNQVVTEAAADKLTNAKLVYDDEPKTPAEVERHPEKEAIKAAMEAELKQLFEAKVGRVMSEAEVAEVMRKRNTILRSRIIYKRKYEMVDGKTVFKKWKARVVAGGYGETAGVDSSWSSFSPTLAFTTIRLLMALACDPTVIVDSWDLTGAYLYTDLDARNLYIRLPKDAGKYAGLVLDMKKVIYGIQAGGRLFVKSLSDQILSFEWVFEGKRYRFKRLMTEKCVYILQCENGIFMIIAHWVDDLVTCVNHKGLRDAAMAKIGTKWQITHEGALEKYVGINFNRSKDGWSWKATLESYIEKLSQRFEIKEVKRYATPMEIGFTVNLEDINNDASPEEVALMQKLMGSLAFAAVTVRFDIAYPVSVLSRYINKPSKKVLNAAKRVLHYLIRTKDFGVKWSSSEDDKSNGGHNVLTAASDASFAFDVLTRKSQSGMVLFMNNGPIAWKSKLQSIVTLSSAESEFVALSATVAEVKYVRMMLEELGHPQGEPTIVDEDNTACIMMSSNETSSAGRCRHVDVKFRFVGEAIERKIVRLRYVPTDFMYADLFTKSLSAPKFERLRDMIISKKDYRAEADEESADVESEMEEEDSAVVYYASLVGS